MCKEVTEKRGNEVFRGLAVAALISMLSFGGCAAIAQVVRERESERKREREKESVSVRE